MTSPRSRKRAASIRRPPSSRRSPAPWSSARSGPGQYVNAGASDPVYVIGDLSTVWLTAFVRETDAASVAVGQEITFNVLALPGRPLTARINYVATAIDPATRRLLVRATIDNKDGAC